MRWHFYSPVSIKPWCWIDGETGIGGNETGVIQMAERLAARSHECRVYCDTPPIWGGVGQTHSGVVWQRYDLADFTQPGIWVLCRAPEVAAKLIRDDQTVWLVVQDFEYAWPASYFYHIDRILFTCQTHRDLIVKQFPHLESRACVTSNGVKVDLIEQLEAAGGLVRNPNKIMYASSPDRGLRVLLKIFSRAREFVPTLELHAFYGFNNIDAIADRPGGWPAMEREKAAITELAAKTRGCSLRGRVTQTELYREWLTSGMMVYPTLFQEMSFVAGREAQCCGAIPIITPIWGQGDHVKHGIFVVGDPADEMTQARFVGEIVRLASNVGLAEQMRAEMMADSRKWCDWNVFVGQWEGMANDIH